MAKLHVFMGMKQSTNFREERGLDSAGVDIVSKGLHIRAKNFIEVFWGGVIGYQDINVHPVRNALGMETLEVLTHGHVGLSKLVGFIQYLFVKGKKGFIGKEDCGLINSADGGKEFGEIEALNRQCI